MICHMCNQDEECRPYGKNAQMICYPCMTSSSESIEIAEQQFKMQLAAAGPNPVIGMEQGPFPAENLAD